MFCPLCGKFDRYCKCKSDGLNVRQRKALEVASEHLYLLTPEELQHLIDIQKRQRVSYSDPTKQRILQGMEVTSGYEQTILDI